MSYVRSDVTFPPCTAHGVLYGISRYGTAGRDGEMMFPTVYCTPCHLWECSYINFGSFFSSFFSSPPPLQVDLHRSRYHPIRRKGDGNGNNSISSVTTKVTGASAVPLPGAGMEMGMEMGTGVAGDNEGRGNQMCTTTTTTPFSTPFSTPRMKNELAEVKETNAALTAAM